MAPATLIDGLVYHYIQVSCTTKCSDEKKSGTILKGNQVALHAEEQELGLFKGRRGGGKALQVPLNTGQQNKMLSNHASSSVACNMAV